MLVAANRWGAAPVYSMNADLAFHGRVGIVTPYKSQQDLIRMAFVHHYGPAILGSVEIATVDGFQVGRPRCFFLCTFCKCI